MSLKDYHGTAATSQHNSSVWEHQALFGSAKRWRCVACFISILITCRARHRACCHLRDPFAACTHFCFTIQYAYFSANLGAVIKGLTELCILCFVLFLSRHCWVIENIIFAVTALHYLFCLGFFYYYFINKAYISEQT